MESESDDEGARDAREEEAAGVREGGGTGITGVAAEFAEDEGDGEGSSGEESAAESSDGSEGSAQQEGDTDSEEGAVDETAWRSEAVGGEDRLGEEEENVASPKSEQGDRGEKGIEEGIEGAENDTESRLRALESSPSGSAGVPEEPAEEGSFQDSDRTKEKIGGHEFDEEEVTDMVASTTSQVAGLSRDSDAENSDLELDLSGESGAVGEKGAELKEKGGEGEEGSGVGGDGGEGAGGTETREEVEGEESQSTLERRYVRTLLWRLDVVPCSGMIRFQQYTLYRYDVMRALNGMLYMESCASEKKHIFMYFLHLEPPSSPLHHYNCKESIGWLVSCPAPRVRKVGLAPHIFKVGAALHQWSQIWTGNVIG